MLIRRATVDEAPTVVTIGFHEYVEELMFLLGLDFSFLTLFRRYIHLIQNEELGHVLVADVDGELAGFYSCRYVPFMLANHQRVCHESGWYVLPKFRGQGIGRALKRETARLAHEHGCGFLQIGSAVTTEKGRSLMEWYQRDGYVPFQLEAFKAITEEDLK